SGFGFGGVNAHLLVEEYHPDSVGQICNLPLQERQITNLPRDTSQPIAIVGMDARFGPWQSLRSFQERVLGGGEPIQPRPKTNAWGLAPPPGYYIEELAVPLDQFRIPPAELREMLPQQALALLSAAAALTDAGTPDESDELRLSTGVFLGINLDLN